MDLIDRSELIYFYFDGDEGEPRFEFYPKDFLDAAPVIEAIPIEFIKEQIADCEQYEEFEDCAAMYKALINMWRDLGDVWVEKKRKEGEEEIEK